jgi:hypothetical protein
LLRVNLEIIQSNWLIMFGMNPVTWRQLDLGRERIDVARRYDLKPRRRKNATSSCEDIAPEVKPTHRESETAEPKRSDSLVSRSQLKTAR